MQILADCVMLTVLCWWYFWPSVSSACQHPAALTALRCASLIYVKPLFATAVKPQVHEEEWSYIPVGGPLPAADQPLTAFGAAANLVHPATGARVCMMVHCPGALCWCMCHPPCTALCVIYTYIYVMYI
jgi:Lycopene cyclase protein